MTTHTIESRQQRLAALFTKRLGKSCEIFLPTEENPYWSFTIGSAKATAIVDELMQQMRRQGLLDKKQALKLDNRWYRQIFRSDDPNFPLGFGSDLPDISIEDKLLRKKQFLDLLDKSLKKSCTKH